MTFLTQSTAQRKLGDAAVLWINPRKLIFDTGTRRPVRQAYLQHNKNKFAIFRFSPEFVKLLAAIAIRGEPFFVPDDCFGPKCELEQLEKYMKVQDVVRCRQDPNASIWSKELKQEIKDCGVAKHKKIRMYNDSDVDNFIQNYVLRLVESVQHQGYDTKLSREFGAAHIDDAGKLTKAGSANHRFYIARIIGQDRFPLKIAGIHERWYDHIWAGRRSVTFERLKEFLKTVEKAHR